MDGKQGRVSRRWRSIALVSVGLSLGLLVAGSPAGANFGTVKHFLTKHVFPGTDKRYYKKAPANARFVNVAEPAGGALDGTYPNPLLRAGAVTPAHISGVPSARVEQTRNATQAMGSGGNGTNVQFGVEIHDTDNMFDPAQNTRITFRTDGVYIVTGAGRWAENASGVRTIGLVLNDDFLQFLAADTRLNNGAAQPVRQHVSAIACFRAGSFVVLRALQDSGGSLNINNLDSPQVHLAATWIAPAPPRQSPLPSEELRNCIEPPT